mmetsp:Transcript_22767/g.44719  ORF Transcript_22767/g.44719 Transcript_22767/m.44719 type:complete len:385 (-) Transcript_22767:796-1950(-)|eukprot:CAMPEP_0171540818 /NCGR_PEP_ID=MMETSP0960-20121227/1417_1 /TAXON_ID=87120 /ORGANISM="Aurantiochytrium limacinum, Strain ATCCMYA-1381" /LENGTH=384 /DNA_ID=CAMNT_0012088079 /DNA_START=256 /DNA_END=1410 /DNA_ORIENTATION=-
MDSLSGLRGSVYNVTSGAAEFLSSSASGSLNVDTQQVPEGKPWLFAVLACFVCVSLWCIVENVRNRRQLSREPDLTNASPGWEMRKWFHLLLAVALFCRSMSIIVELAMGLPRLDECQHLACWAISMIHGVPDMLFMSMYSLLTMFWAQLYYAAWGISYASLRPGFVVANVLLYTIYVAIALISLIEARYRLLHFYMDCLLGGAYLISSVVMIYYGYRVFSQLRSKVLSLGGQEFPGRKMILRRVIILCIVCGSTLLLHAVYCVAALTVFDDRFGYPSKIGTHAFDALSYSIFELIPALVVLMLTVKRRANTNFQNSSSINPRGSRRDLLAEDASSDSFPPPLATPRLMAGRGESLTARLLRSDHELQQEQSNEAGESGALTAR